MATCSKCRAELKPGKKFCTNCGTAVNGPGQDAASSDKAIQKNIETPVFYLGEQVTENNSYADIWDRHLAASIMEVCNDFQHLLDKK
jgi:predicted amidophosphoribosyltransferase